jgi:hypothetical protein|tara:strand:+ start:615 stop:875 length:261 start_codon:yes stop_codon:yes gene_type:complete
MIKALLIVTAMSNGGFDYKTEMPSMESCMEARTAVEQQNTEVKTLCVPYNKEAPEKKMLGVFNLFFDLIERVEMLDDEGACVKEGL